MSKATIPVKTEAYTVDVCNGGCYALFPDGTVRRFRNETECAVEIGRYARKNTRKKEIKVSKIEWRFRDRTVTEEIKRCASFTGNR